MRKTIEKILDEMKELTYEEKQEIVRKIIIKYVTSKI